MRYISTRGTAEPLSFSQAVLEGLARDGGLFVPETVPDFSQRLIHLSGLSYQELAFEIFQPFVNGEISDADLKDLIHRSYQSFQEPGITPIVPAQHHWVLELFHGPTLAFKDVALQFLGNLFEYLLKQNGQKLNILGATSGDTGSAAIYGVRGKANINIFMLHPKGRVSPVQEKQMTTVLDANVFNIAVEGTFDDCQNIVKECFNDLQFRDQYHLGAVNSINWARVMAQIVYYFFAAFRLWDKQPGAPLFFSVPTGNFGDIYAGYLAKKMGLPIERLILATNINDILARCFTKGDYSFDKVNPSYSPSMDIQLSSNFERYLFDLMDRDGKALAKRMEDMKKNGGLQLTSKEMAKVQELFSAASVGQQETLDCIKLYYDSGYLLDPHSAVGVRAADKLGFASAICLATAHPAKFESAVKKAIGIKPPQPVQILGIMEKESKVIDTIASKESIQGIIREKIG